MDNDALTKKSVRLPQRVWSAVGNFRHERKLKTETEAVATLLGFALDAVAGGTFPVTGENKP
jgi:hypothetical protein